MDNTLDEILRCGQISKGHRFFEKSDGMCNAYCSLIVLNLNLLVALERYIFDALMRWIIGSQSTPIRINGDMHQTITAGIGHLHKADTGQTVSTTRLEAPKVVID